MNKESAMFNDDGLGEAMALAQTRDAAKRANEETSSLGLRVHALELKVEALLRILEQVNGNKPS